ncbi:unnamed protein product [Urochloa humidicola]
MEGGGADLKRVMHMLRSERMEEKFRLLGASTLLSELRSAVSLVHTDATISKEIGLRLMFRVRSLATPLRELLETVLHMQMKAEKWHQAPAALFRYIAFRWATLRALREFLDKFNSLSSYLRKELTPHLLRHGDGSSSGSNGAGAPDRGPLQHPLLGRADLLDKMVGILVADRSADRGLLVMPIVGGPGVGKTHLADAILHHGRVRHKFHVRLRVPVTRLFDIRKIKAMMFPTQSLQEVDHMLGDEVSYIASKLSGGEYLIVLDDVWSDNEGKWLDIANLMKALPPNGSVVLTTRTPDIVPKLATIVEAVNGARLFFLQPLEQEFASAFVARWIAACHSDWPPELIAEAGMTIADKCGGVPLLLDYACKFFYQPLYMQLWQEFLEKKSHPDIMYWRELLSCIDDLPRDEFWQRFLGHYPGIPDGNSSAPIKSAFVSYNHLPSDLRKCLSYCSMFPSDYDFDAEELADLLTAEGYIPTIVAKTQRKGFLKQLLDECFYSLQQHEYGDKTTYRMHQVLHIFVQNEGRGSGSVLRADQATQLASKVTAQSSIHIRCASLIINPLTASLPRNMFAGMNLGALVLLQEGAMCPPDQPRCEITEIPHEFSRRIHTLSFRATRISMLPTKFLERYHNMKYLNLSQSDIKSIPSSISRLQLLQTLILSHCDKLQKLHRNTVKLASLQKLDLHGCCNLVDFPPDISRLTSLEYINFTECSSLAQFPRGIGQLKSLQMLLGYIVSSTDGSSTSELQTLANLHRLSLQSLEKVQDLSDVRYARLQQKTRLESLSLQWNMDDYNDNTETAYEVLESLQPHRRLKALEIVAYQGKKLPSWMSTSIITWMACTEPYLKALAEIKLINLRSCELPPLGLLPCLKIAEISGAETICDINDNFYGPNGTFPSLEKLTFSYMHNLEFWKQAHRADMFPRLAELTVIQCSKLRALHMELPSVEKLTLWMDNKVLNGVKGALRGVARNLQHVSVSFSEGLTASSECEGLQDLCELTKLEICGCDELACLPKGLQHLSSIRSLTIDNCRKLEVLPDWLENLSSLQIMRLSGCPLLHYIPGGLEQRNGVIIYVEDCPNLVEEPFPNFPVQSSGEPVDTTGKEIIMEDA